RTGYAGGSRSVATPVRVGLHCLLHRVRSVRDTDGLARGPLGSAADARPDRWLLVSLYHADGRRTQSGHTAGDAYSLRGSRGRSFSDSVARIIALVPIARTKPCERHHVD